MTSEDSTIEELLAKIVLKLSNIDTELERLNEAFSADNEHVFVPAASDTYDRLIWWKSPTGEDRSSRVVAWRISRFDGSVVPVTQHGMPDGPWIMP